MIRSGPAAEDFRHERFSFWPERKNAVERGLSNLLKKPDATSLTAAGIRKEYAAVQGLASSLSAASIRAVRTRHPRSSACCGPADCRACSRSTTMRSSG